MSTAPTAPDLSAVLAFLRAHWSTISALALAVVGVLNPGLTPAVQTILTIVASVLGAVGMGGAAARSAVRSEARRLGLSIKD